MNESEHPHLPEIKTWKLNDFGQVIKVSASLEPDAFPYKVAVPTDSRFFKEAYERVYRGVDVVVRGTKISKSRNKKVDTSVEHIAVMAANDIGELMVGSNVFEGDKNKALTEISSPKYIEYLEHLLKSVKLPPGWRTFGHLHSHPYKFMRHYKELFSFQGPRVDNLPVSWSLGDCQTILHLSKYGYDHLTTLGVITQTQIGLMVASKSTVEATKRRNPEVIKILNTPNPHSSDVPYNKFDKLGIILYGGNHYGDFSGTFILERLI